MDEKPKRRWFRLRLSTVLILTAIVAWGMATPLLVPVELVMYSGGWLKVSGNAFLIPGISNRLYVTKKSDFYVCDGLNMHIVWPALALFSFLAWKAAWAVVARRRRQVAAPE